MKNKPSEDIQRLLKTVVDECTLEDKAVRESQIRTWRRLKLLWEGFSRIWWDEVAHDWRVYDQQIDQESDQAAYDKPINVFRAYLESIIAALSVTVPPIKCFPDDADNTLDLATAKAGDKIAQLVYRHNDVGLLWLHALFIYCTEGMTACYTYPKEDKAFGTYEEKSHDEVEEDHQLTLCSSCGHVLDDTTMPEGVQATSDLNPQGPNLQQSIGPSAGQMGQVNPLQQPSDAGGINQITMGDELDEFMPDNEDAPLHNELINQGSELCPACMQQMDPQITREKFIVTRLVGTTTKMKSRVCMEVYGGLYVKVPNYAKTQKDCPYLLFSFETNYVNTVEKYQDLHGNANLISKLKGGQTAGAYDQYDQWGRLSPQYGGEYPINVITEKHCWLRPAAYNFLNDKADVDKLKALYPDGCCVVYANDEFAETRNESLDDYWTLSYNPLSDHIHFDPLGMLLTSIQEITNDLVSLTLQTIEHGIGQTFVDPAVVNLNAYQQQEVLPGGMFPAVPKSGKALGDGFHELKTATLSPEVMPFSQNIQSMAQLVSGALPSLFGGTIQGSETASQYSMSRAQAQQRLQNTWKIYNSWWKNIFGKVIPMYIKGVKEDERNVEKTNDGNFINTFIRMAELEGKIGRVELESSESLPLTWAQINDIVMKIITTGNPELLHMTGLDAPENLRLIHEAIGLVDFHIPGEDDVVQQYDEIKLLLESEPIPTGDPMNPFEPSVDIDPIMDNSAIGFEIVRKWAVSPAGRQVKIDNEPGYQNVLLHGKKHFMQVQQAQMMAQQQAGAANAAKPNPLNSKEAPITGESDVQVTH